MDDEDRLSIWLSRNIGRSDAEHALAGQRDGVFLVRASVSAPGDYVISVVFAGSVQHHQIKHYKGHMVTLSGRELNSLAELIRHYKEQPDGLPARLTSGCTAYDPPKPKAAPPVPRRESKMGGDVPAIPKRKATSSSSLIGKDLSKYEISPARLSFINAVGSGRFGQVFEAFLAPADGAVSATSGQLVAVKSCKETANEQNRRDFLQEAMLLSNFSHPNVMGLVALVATQDPLLIVLEYVTYGDLRAVLKACRVKGIPVTLAEMLWIATQIAAGMEHLVQRKCIHRDLAARNVLLGHYCTVKITDFGLSRQLEEDSDYYRSVNHHILPIKWMAPECLDGRVFTTANDIWAYGVVLWEVTSLAKTPFKRETTASVLQKIRDGERLPQPRDCPDSLYAIMKTCWNLDQKLRPSFETLHARTLALHSAVADCPPRDIGALVQDGRGPPPKPLLPKRSWEFPREELRYVSDLGEGEFGRVVLMSVCSSSESVAMKMVAVKILADNATPENAAAFEKEMKMLMDCNFQHKHVVTLLGVSTTEEPHMLIMEYMNLGDLQGLLRDSAPVSGRAATLSAEDMVNMGQQIALGCEYLASRDFVHRDIAARNCLVGTGYIVKIADFGLGRSLTESDYYKTQGGILPLRWMAPETVLFGKFSTASDQWAFGVVMYEMFSFGQQPLNEHTNIQIIAALTAMTPLPLVLPPECPPPVVEMVRLSQSFVPEARPSFAAMAATLQRALSEMTAGDGGGDHLYECGEGDTQIKIIKQGWLTKQGGGTTTFSRTNWKRRWFILYSDGALVYQKSGRPTEKVLGVVPLLTASRVRAETAFDASFEGGCCFSVATPDRLYCLVSDVPDEAPEWMRAISSYVKA